MNLLITGGAGFIGSNLLHWLSTQYSHDEFGGIGHLVNLDCFTYAGHPNNLNGLENQPYYVGVTGRIEDRELVRSLMHDYRIDALIHVAAETHVDRSIDDAEAFVTTNVLGTYRLLDEYLKYLRDDGRLADCVDSLSKGGRGLFLNVSTDEVFGSLDETARAFNEDSHYAPNSPYSASKAGADHLARAYFKTHGLPVVQTNCSNNYGPRQFPEKLIPLMIRKVLSGEKLPVYGDGANIRDWLHVNDHCRALETLLLCARPGSRYVIGGDSNLTNLEVVGAILDAVHQVRPDLPQRSCHEAIEWVEDRPGHDRRYAIDYNAIRREFGWKPLKNFQTGLLETVSWYIENEAWCLDIEQHLYTGKRLGQG